MSDNVYKILEENAHSFELCSIFEFEPLQACSYSHLVIFAMQPHMMNASNSMPPTLLKKALNYSSQEWQVYDTGTTMYGRKSTVHQKDSKKSSLS